MPSPLAANFGTAFSIVPVLAPPPPIPPTGPRFVYINNTGTFKLDGANGECIYTWVDGSFNDDVTAFEGFFNVNTNIRTEFGFLYQAANTPGFKFYFLFSDLPHFVGGAQSHFPIYFSWNKVDFFLWPSTGTIRHVLP